MRKTQTDVRELWFDVGIKRYTTAIKLMPINCRLWFDVGIKRYTTSSKKRIDAGMLWFDVGIKRYTTALRSQRQSICCGLM